MTEPLPTPGDASGPPQPAARGASAASPDPTSRRGHRRYTYRAQSAGGEATLEGTITAAHADAARQQLRGAGLVVTYLAPAEPTDQPRWAPLRRRLGSADVALLGEQLAQLTWAGLPLERGLWLIAGEMPGGRLRRSIRQLADDLAVGKPIGEAVAAPDTGLPPSFGRVLEAGIATGNLPAVLEAFTTQVMMRRRLRAALGRTLAYPLMVIAALVGVAVFLGIAVVPTLREAFDQVDATLPATTRSVFFVSEHLGWIALGLALVAGLAAAGIWAAAGNDAAAGERMKLAVPLVGRYLRTAAAATWCRGLGIAIQAGLDMPAALAAAGETTGSAMATADTRQLIDRVESGQRMSEASDLAIVPRSAVVSIELAAAQGDLPATLRSLAGSYEQQAAYQLGMLRATLLPAAIVLLAVLVGWFIVALFMPVHHLMDWPQ